MAITLVQSKSVNSGATSSATISLTLDTPPTPGNILILAASIFSTGGNAALTPDPNISWMYWTVTGSNNVGVFVGLGRVFTGAGSTFTLTQSIGGQALSVSEYSGANITLDRFITQTGTGSLPSTGSTGTTSKFPQLWFGVLSVRNSVVFSSPTAGFTILLQDRSTLASVQDRSLAVLTFTSAATGSATTSATVGTAGVYYGAMLTLQENPTGGGGGETAFGSST